MTTVYICLLVITLILGIAQTIEGTYGRKISCWLGGFLLASAFWFWIVKFVAITPMDVYQGKTTLEYKMEIVNDSIIKTDSTVVWK